MPCLGGVLAGVGNALLRIVLFESVFGGKLCLLC